MGTAAPGCQAERKAPQRRLLAPTFNPPFCPGGTTDNSPPVPLAGMLSCKVDTTNAKVIADQSLLIPQRSHRINPHRPLRWDVACQHCDHAESHSDSCKRKRIRGLYSIQQLRHEA